jgi:hypothetical protein
MTTRYDRRRFLASAAALGAVLAWPSAEARPRQWHERRDLYAEGVASGDPAPDSVILWTRRQTSGPLFLEVARDEGFVTIVSHAEVTPREENDWTVRVLAAGLAPSTTYWYRFSDAQGQGSRIGRTRTAPAPDDTRPVSFAFVSCQNETAGANNAYRRMIFEDETKPESDQLGFVLHLGDFFYELVWYPEDRKTYYSRTIRELVRFPKARSTTTITCRWMSAIIARSSAPISPTPISPTRGRGFRSSASGTITNSRGRAGKALRITAKARSPRRRARWPRAAPGSSISPRVSSGRGAIGTATMRRMSPTRRSRISTITDWARRRTISPRSAH